MVESNGKIGQIIDEKSSFLVKKLSNGEIDTTLAVWTFLDSLKEYSKNVELLENAFYKQNKEELRKKFIYIKVGHVIHEMLNHSCSQRQAFKAFSIWLNLSERQIANYYYQFREEFLTEKSNSEFDNVSYFLMTLPFFGELDKEKVVKNPVTFRDELLEEFPSEYPVAKRAYKKAFDRFLTSQKEFLSLGGRTGFFASGKSKYAEALEMSDRLLESRKNHVA